MLDINLLAWRDIERKKDYRNIYYAYLLSISMILLLIFLLRNHFLNQLEINSNIYQEQLLLNEDNKKNNQIKLQHQAVLVQLFNLFSAVNPKVNFNAMISKDKTIVLMGVAASIEYIRQFMGELLRLQNIDFVKINSLAADINGLQFQLFIQERES